MKIGPDCFYECSACGNVLRNRSLISGNMFKAVYFSDGRLIAPMRPDIPELTQCPKCNAILWMSELKKIGERHMSRRIDWNEHQEWQAVERVKHLELDDLWRALKEGCYSRSGTDIIKKETFIRRRIWWAYNEREFQSTKEIEDWRKNCLNMLDRFLIGSPDNLCVAAELYRNLCNFRKCRETLRELPEQYADFKERIEEECEHHNPKTVRLHLKKKHIETENYYDILQNEKKELLFCIGEHEGEPDSPEIVYAGGEHALLYRSKDHIVILDFVHPDVRDQLMKAEQALVAEFHKTGEEKGIIREYIADVNIYGQLPEERGLQHLLPESRKKTDIASRLTEKMEQDNATAQNAFAFYQTFAENCNAEAQYALAQLYLDERFYNLSEALRRTEYAAFQGYKPAVEALLDFETDDDGRYDAWV